MQVQACEGSKRPQKPTNQNQQKFAHVSLKRKQMKAQQRGKWQKRVTHEMKDDGSDINERT